MRGAQGPTIVLAVGPGHGHESESSNRRFVHVPSNAGVGRFCGGRDPLFALSCWNWVSQLLAFVLVEPAGGESIAARNWSRGGPNDPDGSHAALWERMLSSRELIWGCGRWPVFGRQALNSKHVFHGHCGAVCAARHGKLCFTKCFRGKTFPRTPTSGPVGKNGASDSSQTMAQTDLDR